jgi:hypothetical protein
MSDYRLHELTNFKPLDNEIVLEEIKRFDNLFSTVLVYLRKETLCTKVSLTKHHKTN